MFYRQTNNPCPTCNSPGVQEPGERRNLFFFTDELSCQEFDITSMCQPCQDTIFTPDTEE